MFFSEMDVVEFLYCLKTDSSRELLRRSCLWSRRNVLVEPCQQHAATATEHTYVSFVNTRAPRQHILRVLLSITDFVFNVSAIHMWLAHLQVCYTKPPCFQGSSNRISAHGHNSRSNLYQYISSCQYSTCLLQSGQYRILQGAIRIIKRIRSTKP